MSRHLVGYTLSVRDERLWNGDQALCGSLVGYYGDILVRARIKRDAYDNQCEAWVETWTRDGWREVKYVPIHDLHIFGHSYVTKLADWAPSMRASLLVLCNLGLTILVKDVPNERGN
jgi:hypothetical protein